MQGKMRVAVVGCGEMGLIRSLVVKNIEYFELACVIDSNIIKARLLGNQMDVKYYMNLRKALKNENVDAVIICTPASAHYDNALELLECGVHLYCEKPLATTAESSYKMYKYAENKGIMHGIGYNYRFYPTFKKMKELIDCSMLGRIFYIRMVANSSEVTDFGDSKIQKERVNKFGHYGAMGVHAIDLLLWYGGDVEYVSAIVTKKFSTDVSDYISGVCRFKNGIHGIIDMSWSHHGYVDKSDLALTITGDNGTANVNMDYIDIYIKEKTNHFEAGEHRIYNTEIPSSCGFSYTTRCLGNDIEEFGKALMEKTRFKPDWLDGYYVDEFVQALESSGGEKVNLPLTKDVDLLKREVPDRD